MGESFISPLALIEDNVIFEGVCFIDAFCIIRSGAIIGDQVKISSYCEIRSNVILGARSTFGSRCTISSNASIGSDCNIKYGFVLTDTPDLENLNFKKIGRVGNRVKIGANVTLMPGFSIGDGSTVGACSQVRTDIGPNEVWFGNPATRYR